MRDIKYSEIIKLNKILGVNFKEKNSKKYKISILSNIMVHQSKEIGEYSLRKNDIYAEIDIGNYDNLVQDSENIDKSDAIIIFWELCNIFDGIEYKIDLISEKKYGELIKKVKKEIELIFNNIQLVPLVLINRFSSLIFTQDELNNFRLKKLELTFNKFLEKYSSKYKNIKIIDTDKILSKCGIENSVDYRFFYASKTLYSINFFKFYFNSIAPIFKAANGKIKKALILDCDNTLWKGILGEDGFENIIINKEIQYYARKLSRRGILIGLCSKNNYEDVENVLNNHKEMVLKNKDIVIKKVNWIDKVTNLKSISNELNIGLDSIIFMDDSDFELNLIRKGLPMVEVIKVPNKNHELPILFNYLNRIFYNFIETSEDKKKTLLYKAQIERDNYKNESTNINEYLINLRLKIKVYFNNEKLISRMAQLTQKTNQFNLTTKRYTENDLEIFLKDTQQIVIAINVSDMFGDYGIVGLIIIKYKESIAEIDTFLLSCRVLGRNIEFRLMDIICNKLKNLGIKRLYGKYQKTKKNIQVSDLYERFGFEIKSSYKDTLNYELILNNYCHSNFDYIKVIEN